MTAKARRMHLSVFWLGTGNHSAGWRMDGATDSNCDWEILKLGAQIAERGKFDMFFISDSLAPDLNDHPSFLTRFEPTVATAALAHVTSRIGLGSTVSTSFAQPYTVARTYQSLQHMTKGRAAWNVVTSTADRAALNYGMDRQYEHDKRYEIASEFVDVVQGLWDTFDEGAILKDKRSGVYADRSKVRTLDHQGKYFKVRGPLNVEKPKWGNPLIIQAGGSVPGQELSARTADVVFAVVNGDTEAAKANYDSLKGRTVKYGRKPSDISILPGVMPIIADTDAAAKAQLDKLQSFLTPTNALTLVSNRVGHDLSKFDLDAPVPDLPATNNSQTFASTLLALARREKMTLRDLYNLTAAARGHWVICGTPKKIADTLEEWFRAERCDGFMILPAYFPGAFDDFVDKVVPELQRRGIFRKDYEGETLREHFGVSGS